MCCHVGSVLYARFYQLSKILVTKCREWDDLQHMWLINQGIQEKVKTIDAVELCEARMQDSEQK